MADSSPRFRHDLIATTVEVDGVRYIDVRDPDRGTGFRFYDFEYELARQLDGRPVAEVSAWAIATYGLDLTPVGIEEFAARLAELGFLEGSVPSGVPADISARTTLVGQPPMNDPRAPEDESRPLSEVVSRVVDAPPAATPSPSPALVAVMAAPASRRPSQEVPALGVAASTRISGPREVARTDAAFIPETVMGFAALTEPIQKPRESTVEAAEAIGTVMGFAAVTEEQVRAAEAAAVAAGRVVAGSLNSGSGRVGSGPTVTGERRMPPRPESVVMAPFEVDDKRHHRTVSQSVRRPVTTATDRSTILVVLIVAAAVTAAIVGYYFWSQREAALETRRVRVIAPRPAAVYRWFETSGTAIVAANAPLAFATGGSVSDVLPAGSHYAAGEVIAKLQGAAAHEAEVNRARSRVASNQQIRDSMKAANNLPEMRKAEIAMVEKQAKLDEAEAALDRLVIRATESGEVVEVVAQRGSMVEANAPAVRVRTGQIHGEFILNAKDGDAAAHLGFCRVQIIGVGPAATADGKSHAAGADAGAAETGPRFADCRLMGPPQLPNHRLEVELPPSAGILLGQPLLLARVRYDGVFPVPRSAIVRVSGVDRVYVVGPGNAAQARAITIADADPDEVVLSQGIDVGDRVVVDPPSDLREGTPLTIGQSL